MTGTPGKRVGRLEGIVIDVGDLERAVEFWALLTGYEFGPSFTPQCRATVMPESGIRLVLQQVPETKVVKNRVHLDIEVPDLEQALTQVETLGGRLVSHVHNPGVVFPRSPRLYPIESVSTKLFPHLVSGTPADRSEGSLETRSRGSGARRWVVETEHRLPVLGTGPESNTHTYVYICIYIYIYILLSILGK